MKLFKLIFYSHLREIFELISSLEEVATFRLVPMRGRKQPKRSAKGDKRILISSHFNIRKLV